MGWARTTRWWGALAVATLAPVFAGSPSVRATPLPKADRAPEARVPSTSSAAHGVRAREGCDLGTRFSRWTSARLAAQTVVVPVDEGDVGAVAREVSAGVGGVILFGDDATAGLAAALRSLRDDAPVGVAPAVMVDEEGGAVQRLAHLVGVLPSAREMGATLSPSGIEALGLREGRRLAALGVTVDLAPVLDLDDGDGPNSRDPDGTRSFSVVPEKAAADGLAFAEGLEAGGVLPVFKHFPGLGDASGNTDVGPASTLPIADLRTGGLLPFAQAIAHGARAIMVANASVPGLSLLPASISAAVVSGLLRHTLGFSGLVITDALSAPSVTTGSRTIADAVVDALAAGADMVLFTADADAVAPTTAAITAAVAHGVLTRARIVTAAARVLRAKGELPRCPAG